MRTDLKACDTEKIHLPGAVQAHGCLLAFTWPERRIQIASENVGEILGRSHRELLGSRVDHLFDSKFVKELTNLVETRPWKSSGRHLKIRPRVGELCFDAFFYESDRHFVLELEPFHENTEAHSSEIETGQVLREFMMSCQEQKSVQDLSQLVCHSIRRITGLDRVMMYRFSPPTWYGEVIAEDRVAHAHSYLGHRFPAKDIPVPARELYLRNQVRLIPDLNAEVSKLSPPINPTTKKPLDLSDSRLRAVAPVHIEYLKNMDVQASFSIAVTFQGQLWGLITCHHLSPIMISQSVRTTCEIIAQCFSVQAPLLENYALQEERLDFEVKTKMVLDSLRLSPNPLDDFFKQHRTICQTFQSGGIAMVSHQLLDFAGIIPLRADTEALTAWLRSRMKSQNKNVIAIDNLTELDPQWKSLSEYASGILAAMISDVTETMVIFFRPEFRTTIQWGGDPRVALEKREFPGRINPRTSFETWEENVVQKSKPWRKFEIDGIVFLRDFIFDGLAKKEQLIRELSRDLIKS